MVLLALHSPGKYGWTCCQIWLASAGREKALDTPCRNTSAVGMISKPLRLSVLRGFDLNVVQWPNITPSGQTTRLLTTQPRRATRLTFSFQVRLVQALHTGTTP